MEEQLLETWRISNRINLYVLEAINPEALSGVSLSKGRSVAKQFEHIHSARLMWLKVAAPDLMEGLVKFEKNQNPDKEQLKQALEASGAAIEELLKRGFASGGKIKGFKPHAPAFLGYLIAHDSYHRGEIGIILKQSGHPLDDKIAYGMWEWGVR